MTASIRSALATLSEAQFVDLTHAFHPGIPHCGAFQPEQRTTLYDHVAGVGTLGSGFLAHEYRLVGQWGTHVDPPLHFDPNGRSLDAIPVREMILPLVVLNISDRVKADPDACVTREDVMAWESSHGSIPAGAFVALATGWADRWPDPIAMANRDATGVMHFPGWSADVLTLLSEERDIHAIGHDTTDTDPGVVVSAGAAPLEDYWLRRGKWQIEMLANLESVPPSGAIMFATWPKPLDGSGFPARCFAAF
jgi:kynurenine formamidase